MTQPEDEEHDGRTTVQDYSVPPRGTAEWRPNTYRPGTFIGGVWEVEQTLGKGGMGSVYRCHNRYAPRILAAIKLLDPAFQYHPEAKARFLREAEILYTINHPNVVKVSNVLLDAAPPYIEMEFVDGLALEDELGQWGPLPPKVAVERARQLAHALRYLHRKGIYHRDVKPQNILIRKDGEPKLVDFGLAVEIGGDRITQQTQVNFGTVSYCPPEWGQAGELDPAAWDLYALGVVLYEMLTGSVAFPVAADADARRQMVQVMSDKQRVEALDPGPRFPASLRGVVRRLTHRDPTKRIASAKALLVDLDGVDLDVPRPPPVKPTPQPEVEPILPAPVPSAPSTSWITALSFLGSVMIVGLLVGLGAGGLALFLLQERVEYRDAQVVVQGAEGIPVSVRVADQPASRVEGQRHAFKRLPVGELVVEWAVGEDCVAACDPCPVWCRTGTEIRTLVEDGSDEIAIAIPTAPMKIVEIRVKGVEEGFVRIGALYVAVVDGVVAFDLPPGRHTLVAGLGTCLPGCTGDVCGEECVVFEQDLIVPGEGRMAVTVLTVAVSEEGTDDEVSVPVLAPRPEVPAVEPEVLPEPDVPPEAAPSSSGKRVNRRRYARWLGAHPEWGRETAAAEGRADGGYLSGWRGTKPPNPASAPMTGLPWGAARAYCAGRGGLAALNAPPTAWSSGPQMEWRASSNPQWLRRDGQSRTTRASATDLEIGFRCAR